MEEAKESRNGDATAVAGSEGRAFGGPGGVRKRDGRRGKSAILR